MKKIFLAITFFYCSTIFGQSSEGTIYMFNKDWHLTAQVDSCIYFSQLVKESDSVFVYKYYHRFGPMMRFESFRDSTLTIRNGMSAWYSQTGYIDSVGSFKNGLRDDYWVYGYTENFSPIRVALYSDGVMVPDEQKKSPLISSKKQLYSPAIFPGGLEKFTRYIETHTNTPKTFNGFARNARPGNVIISMEIDTEGKVISVFPMKSFQWNADTEAMRVLKNSPKWNPAIRNGKREGYFHIQKVSFEF